MSIYKGDKLVAGSGLTDIGQTKTGSFPDTSKTGIVNSNCVLTEGTWLVFVELLFHPDHLQGDVVLTIGNAERPTRARCGSLSNDTDFVTIVDIVTVAKGESKAVGINILTSTVVDIHENYQFWYVKAVRIA